MLLLLWLLVTLLVIRRLNKMAVIPIVITINIGFVMTYIIHIAAVHLILIHRSGIRLGYGFGYCQSCRFHVCGYVPILLIHMLMLMFMLISMSVCLYLFDCHVFVGSAAVDSAITFIVDLFVVVVVAILCPSVGLVFADYHHLFVCPIPFCVSLLTLLSYLTSFDTIVGYQLRVLLVVLSRVRVYQFSVACLIVFSTKPIISAILCIVDVWRYVHTFVLLFLAILADTHTFEFTLAVVCLRIGSSLLIYLLVFDYRIS